jgi:hypothetical protein
MQIIVSITKKVTKVVFLKLSNTTVAPDSGSGAVSGHVVGYSLWTLHEVDQPPNHVRLIKRLVYLHLLIFSPGRTCARKILRHWCVFLVAKGHLRFVQGTSSNVSSSATAADGLTKD